MTVTCKMERKKIPISMFLVKGFWRIEVFSKGCPHLSLFIEVEVQFFYVSFFLYSLLHFSKKSKEFV